LKKVKQLVQRVLAMKAIKASVNKVSSLTSNFFSLTYIFSIPYNLIVFFPFMREQRAVLSGKAKYYKNLKSDTNHTRVALRRNVHRIEKALLMRPRKPTFSTNYIYETVEWYSRGVKQWSDDENSYDESELIWAHNVLTKYFREVKEVPVISEARTLFERQEYTPDTLDSSPYKRSKPKNLPSYDQLLSLSMYRRSVRWYTKKKVNRRDIDDALLVARQSPTACNRLPYEFRIYDDPKLVNKISNTPFGTGGYADNIPVIAVVIGKLGSYFSNRDRHAIYVDSSLAAMSFIFALETKNISSCIINWPDFEPLEAKMQKMLGLNFDERPIMLIAIGYADPNGEVAFSQKKTLSNIRSYNKVKQ